ncbi:SCP2 sterol-binding domain-containing protein [Candidatus Solincola tengchongensis]|uniref:SCP2 sterol-binding domain-containing protein n=1 Tax=Candidatus Solincola tengchongensis TaxID=2900693 RepID=UPI00257A940C|nr:SCP2 sterol-binding domain-containing protein [Candidatus Solincola tengchongensis]
MALTYGTEEWEKAYLELVKERQATQSKPYIMGTPEWVAQYEELVQNDAEYKEAAKDWEGSVVIKILAKPEIGLDDDLYMFMDLWHGDCRFIRIVPPEVGESGDYVITGEYERWKSVMAKELDTVKAMMQGKLKLKGDLPSIVRAVKAASRLVDLSASTNPRFPDELSPEEIEDLRKLLREAKEKFGI